MKLEDFERSDAKTTFGLTKNLLLSNQIGFSAQPNSPPPTNCASNDCLNFPPAMLKLRCINQRGGAQRRLEIMISLMFFGMLSGLVGLIAYEVIEEVRGAKHKLHDRYHE
jgi:hypothetical protein